MDKGGYTPHEPFRSHQDWEGSLSLIVGAGLHGGRHVRFRHLARGLILVPYWLVSSCLAQDPTAPPDLKALPRQYAGERGGAPCPPTPPIPVLPHPTFNSIGRSPDRTLNLWPVKLATDPGSHPHDSVALPVADHALCHRSIVNRHRQLTTPSSKSGAKTSHPSLTQTRR